MIKFTKMHGLGNDYVYIDCTKEELNEDIPELARKMSNRHFGIGSDGIILICKSDIADFKMKMFNFDGSEAEMCGNGIRCVGKFVYDKGLTKKEELKIETLAGIKVLKLNVENKKVKTIQVDMGKPILEPEKIPVISKQNPVTDLKINALDKEFICTCVSMGNPHAVTEIENTENFERGAGETLACGTGACAVSVACNLKGKTNNKVEVQLLGGNLQIEWNKENNHVYMTGPAETVFEGIWE